MHRSISQMKHQLDATLCRFYFCRVTLHVSGASVHRQEYLKLVQRPLVHVLSLQVSHHISLLGPEALIMRCDDWPTTITHVPVAAVLVLNTPDDGRLHPKHVEWLCRNKTCTVLHQVGVSLDWQNNFQTGDNIWTHTCHRRVQMLFYCFSFIDSFKRNGVLHVTNFHWLLFVYRTTLEALFYNEVYK